ncbi:YiiX/YebB-like N1pC/P60 family cysteine hydrolase [Photobacterium sanguinicancri]|uniref:YiiX/YebB-like N1pC/P60 family cysteine hydrolase n=1 Tax=Photobacterium sanguinicancri TaxID=875932 RepID=UPI0021C31E53|nr:YiiX/YebB-like N1pC/P60 family cysteine hydrolase [Photobacterium sanguinicancri]
MYLLDRTKLKPGDIILTRSNEKNSSLICKITKSDFSHAILHVGESSYIHSDPYGVHSSNIQRLLIDELRFAKVVRVDNPVAIEKAIAYARLQVGTSYSKVSAANAFAKVFTKLDAKRQFCSRLVAKAFESAGVRLVANSDACLPQEIADSIFVHEVKDCVYQAEPEEIEFANSFDPIKKQTEITNSILKSTRKLLGNKIQSLSDITSALIADPKYDNEITKIYESSGYLTMWVYEQERNPWRYSVDLFRALPLSESEQYALATRELKIANRLLGLYKNNLEQYFYIRELHGLKYANQQFILYKKLVENALDHKFTAEDILGK